MPNTHENIFTPDDYARMPISRRGVLTTAAGGLLFAAACGKKEQASEWQHFRSSTYPYEIDYPGSWQQRRITTNGQPIDAFLGPQTRGIPSYVTITSGTPRFTTLDEEVRQFLPYAQQEVLARNQGKGSVRIVSTPSQNDPEGLNHVGQYPAYQIETQIPSTNNRGAATEKSMIFFADNALWHMDLTTDPSVISQFLPQFKHMLDSFAVVPIRRG